MVKYDLIFAKAIVVVDVQWNSCTNFYVTSVIGFIIPDMLYMNLQQKLINPTSSWTWITVLGSGQFRMVDIYSGSMNIPFSFTLKPNILV